MRLVITIPDIPSDPALAAEVLRERIADLEQTAVSIAGEIGPELRPGQYGFTTDPDTHALRLHWAARDEHAS